MNGRTAPSKSQAAQLFLYFAVIVFGLQVLFGLIAAAQFVWPDFLFGKLNFNINRMIHINAMVVWLLSGFMGGVFYLLSEEAGGELYSEKLARITFWLWAAGVVAVVLGYLYMGIAGKYSFLLSEGREYIEAPRWADFAIVLVVLLFLYNVVMTIHTKVGWNPLTGVLTGGLVGLAVFYLFGMTFERNLSKDFYWWWWVIHLWVEGTWELVAVAIMGLTFIRIFGLPREVAYRYAYLEAGLALFTGIIGTGHHYYWIGTPAYWLVLGGVFSALEPLPLFLMMIDAVKIARKHPVQHPNELAKLWAVGGAIYHFLGAGVWGVLHTLPQVNRWTHGTQITPAHGHMAFYGAYAMLVIMVLYYALPRMRFGHDSLASARGKWAFWLMIVGNVGMVLALTAIGVAQALVERMAGVPFRDFEQFGWIFFTLRFAFGIMFAVGFVVFLIDVFFPREAEETAKAEVAVHQTV